MVLGSVNISKDRMLDFRCTDSAVLGLLILVRQGLKHTLSNMYQPAPLSLISFLSLNSVACVALFS
jgi:hypothetical protein